KCPRCQHDNPLGARFCEECATPLARTCSNCGTALSVSAKFCHSCAHHVAAVAGLLRSTASPIPHEDHSVRACYAVLRMQESVKKYAYEVRRPHAFEGRVTRGF